MNKPTLKVAFSDFHKGFNPKENRIYRALETKYLVEIVTSKSNPKILVYSDFGTEHWSFDGLKIYVTGENMVPDLRECDLAFTPFEMAGEPRAIRLPYYAQILEDPLKLLRPDNYQPNFKEKEGFCAFVTSNPKSPERNKFFKKLNRKRTVDSGGRHFNNLGKIISDKMCFIKDYRFTIAFENTSSPGYTTEKLIEPLLVGSIPIYWGNPEVGRDFDVRCMINIADFPNEDEAIDYILSLENNIQAQKEILQSPIFKNNCLPDCLSDDYILKPIDQLLKHGKAGVRFYRRRRLREHVYANWLKQTQVSLTCRLESLAWKLGLRF